MRGRYLQPVGTSITGLGIGLLLGWEYALPCTGQLVPAHFPYGRPSLPVLSHAHPYPSTRGRAVLCSQRARTRSVSLSSLSFPVLALSPSLSLSLSIGPYTLSHTHPHPSHPTSGLHARTSGILALSTVTLTAWSPPPSPFLFGIQAFPSQFRPPIFLFPFSLPTLRTVRRRHLTSLRPPCYLPVAYGLFPTACQFESVIPSRTHPIYS